MTGGGLYVYAKEPIFEIYTALYLAVFGDKESALVISTLFRDQESIHSPNASCLHGRNQSVITDSEKNILMSFFDETHGNACQTIMKMLEHNIINFTKVVV